MAFDLKTLMFDLVVDFHINLNKRKINDFFLNFISKNNYFGFKLFGLVLSPGFIISRLLPFGFGCLSRGGGGSIFG